MKWLKFKVKTVTEAEDIIISTLYDCGFEGAQIEDKIPLTALDKEQMFVDILPETEEDDGIAYLSFFLEELDESKDNGYAKKQGSKYPTLLRSGVETSAEEVLKDVNAALDELRDFGIEIGEGSVELSETEDLDWVNNWKKYFHQFYIDDLLVVPSWEEVAKEDMDKTILHIDPGTAFGTGAHDTTQLCIKELRKYITPETELLDVGTGSGILAIVSLMFGIKHAVGTDIDPCSTAAVEDNMLKNNISAADFDMMIGNIIADKAIQDKVGYNKYDIVVANILADVLVPLTPIVANHIKKDGIFITSGIIDGKEIIVKEAMEKAGFTILGIAAQGEWRAVVSRR